MKDLPNELAEGLTIGATPARGDVRDVLVARRDGTTISTLRSGAVLGTSSIRRKAQLRAMRSDISVVDLHGNVDTRLLKIERDNLDGIVIAAAGLERLGESRRVSQYFSPGEMVPAPCQGAIAVEMREGDAPMASVLSRIDNGAVRAETICERSFARALGSDCDVPAGASASMVGGTVTLGAIILSPDGGRAVKGSAASEVADAEGLGARARAPAAEGRGGRTAQEREDPMTDPPKVKKVLITRTHEGNLELAAKLRAIGIEPIIVDVLALSPPEDWSQVDGRLGELGDYDWLVFTSAPGARFFVERARILGIAPGDGRTKIAAVGTKTAGTLASAGWKVDFMPTRFLARALAEELPGGGEGAPPPHRDRRPVPGGPATPERVRCRGGRRLQDAEARAEGAGTGR